MLQAMLHCAEKNVAELVIVSTDLDYGVSFEGKQYVNDDLRQEFSDRVSKKRKLLLYEKLSDAVKHFERPITPQEQEAESEIVNAASEQHGPDKKQTEDWLSTMLSIKDIKVPAKDMKEPATASELMPFLKLVKDLLEKNQK
jgi:hypothetical protein